MLKYVQSSLPGAGSGAEKSCFCCPCDHERVDVGSGGPNKAAGQLGQRESHVWTGVYSDRAGTFLNSISFHVGNNASPAPLSFLLNYQAYIQRFDEATESLVGPILYESAPLVASRTQWQTITLSTNSLPLIANETYMLYLSDLEQSNPAINSNFIGFQLTHPANPNLGIVHYNNTGTFGPNGPAGSWVHWNGQMTITANLSDTPLSAGPTGVPEVDPAAATVPLALTMLLGVILVDRRRPAVAQR